MKKNEIERKILVLIPSGVRIGSGRLNSLTDLLRFAAENGYLVYGTDAAIKIFSKKQLEICSINEEDFKKFKSKGEDPEGSVLALAVGYHLAHSTAYHGRAYHAHLRADISELTNLGMLRFIKILLAGGMFDDRNDQSVTDLRTILQKRNEELIARGSAMQHWKPEDEAHAEAIGKFVSTVHSRANPLAAV